MGLILLSVFLLTPPPEVKIFGRPISFGEFLSGNLSGRTFNGTWISGELTFLRLLWGAHVFSVDILGKRRRRSFPAGRLLNQDLGHGSLNWPLQPFQLVSPQQSLTKVLFFFARTLPTRKKES